MQPGSSSPVRASQFASGLTAETAFTVLAAAQKLMAQGKDVVRLEIGDSPFPSTKSALAAGKQAIDSNATHYCASVGLPAFRETIARNYQKEFGVGVAPEQVVVAPGAKPFEAGFRRAAIRAPPLDRGTRPRC